MDISNNSNLHDINCIEKFDIFEGMTSISALIGAISDGTSMRKIIKVLYNKDIYKKKIREITFLKYRSADMGFELAAVDTDIIDSLANGNTHGGFIAIVTKREFLPIVEFDIKSNGFYALIDGIEDPYNFGYCVRSLYASGADGLILPKRNWMEASGVVARSSAGTSELLPIYAQDTEEAVLMFKKSGYKVMCAEIRNSVSLYDVDFKDPILFIIGGEKRGISSKIAKHADINVRIDYERSFNGSLPTVSAVSVIAFHASHMRKM